jgi:ubiquinone/menaquinone biosynthesis C-methylase UbiE
VGATDSDAYLASGFRNVDTSTEVGKFISCLRFMDNLTSFQDYKEAIIDQANVNTATSVLDVGCGIGFDVVRMASIIGNKGRVVGLDPSESLIEAARRNPAAKQYGIKFLRGVGEQLPFPSESFDICRIDRTLQHVEDPHRVICEMARVLKPGGRIACAEPDWGTFVVTGDDRSTTREVVKTWCEGFRNGWIGRSLKPALKITGFEGLKLTGHLLVTEGFDAIDKVFDVSVTITRMREFGLNIEKLDRWLSELRNQGDSLACVTLFLATGVKP